MDRVIIITGGSSGIGLAASKFFIKDGDRVYNFSRRPSPDRLAHNIKVDVSDFSQMQNAVNEVITKEGRIDVLVNSAGFSLAAPLEHIEREDYKYLFDVNFFGTLDMIRLVVPHMKEQGGRIINVSSVAALTPIAYDPYYCASKAAINALTESLQPELRTRGIYITSLMPGGTKTPFSYKRKIYDREESLDYYLDQTRAADELFKIEQEGMNAGAVAREIFNLSLFENPPIITATGLKNKLYYHFSRIAPKKLIYSLSMKKYNQRN